MDDDDGERRAATEQSVPNKTLSWIVHALPLRPVLWSTGWMPIVLTEWHEIVEFNI